MFETFLILITCHFLADFHLRLPASLDGPYPTATLFGNAALLVCLSCLALGSWQPVIATTLFTVSAFRDLLQRHILPQALWQFLLSQGAAILVCGALSYLHPGAFDEAGWGAWAQGGAGYYLVVLALVSGLIAVLSVSGMIIRLAVEPFTKQLTQAPGAATGASLDGLENGGYVIGCLERLLVLLFIFINQPAGVGFLVTAKSILRFGDINNPAERKMTEYIIIGTFLSFGLALGSR